jgi:hypothetical protein
MPKRIADVGVPLMFALSAAIIVDRYTHETETLKADIEFFGLNDLILLVLYILAFYKPVK